MSKVIEYQVLFEASPHEIYEMLMDSNQHAEFTGEDAQISRRVGGVIHAYGGYIEGKNIELVPDAKIVQEWRGSNWPPEVVSVATFILTPTQEGTKLVFTNEGVPSQFFKSISLGWESQYWKKMKEAIAERK